MERADLAALLKSTGLPVSYRNWGKAKAPDLPYLLYFFIGGNDLAADNMNHATVQRWCVELYSKSKDDESEAAVERLLKMNEIPYSKNEVGPTDDGPCMTAYYFTAY